VPAYSRPGDHGHAGNPEERGADRLAADSLLEQQRGKEQRDQRRYERDRDCLCHRQAHQRVEEAGRGPRAHQPALDVDHEDLASGPAGALVQPQRQEQHEADGIAQQGRAVGTDRDRGVLHRRVHCREHCDRKQDREIGQEARFA
jgi:hypothetical protein